MDNGATEPGLKLSLFIYLLCLGKLSALSGPQSLICNGDNKSANFIGLLDEDPMK